MNLDVALEEVSHRVFYDFCVIFMTSVSLCVRFFLTSGVCKSSRWRIIVTVGYFLILIDQLVFKMSEHVESCHRAGSETENRESEKFDLFLINRWSDSRWFAARLPVRSSTAVNAPHVRERSRLFASGIFIAGESGEEEEEEEGFQFAVEQEGWRAKCALKHDGGPRGGWGSNSFTIMRCGRACICFLPLLHSFILLSVQQLSRGSSCWARPGRAGPRVPGVLLLGPSLRQVTNTLTYL